MVVWCTLKLRQIDRQVSPFANLCFASACWCSDPLRLRPNLANAPHWPASESPPVLGECRQGTR
jgi:hypothetical protein